MPITLHVWEWGGSDTFGDGSAGRPYKTIQRAVDGSPAIPDSATILVAGGTYPPFQIGGKWINIIGCLLPPNWDTPNPVNAPSWIDGKHTSRCIYVHDLAALNMSYIFCRYGQDWQFGGGLYSISSIVEITNSVFAECAAFGRSNIVDVSGQANGDVAAGGGICIMYPPKGATITIQDCRITNCGAVGGNGVAGGYGQGGGLFVAGATLRIARLTLTSNLAQGGQSTVGLKDNYKIADAIGGAVDLEQCEVTLFDTVEMGYNQAIGGSAPMDQTGGWAGSGFGGGMQIQQCSGIFSNLNVHNNLALGGNAYRSEPLLGSDGEGGALYIENGIKGSNITFTNCNIVNNKTQAGNTGSEQLGPFGNIHIQARDGNTYTYIMQNIVLQGNMLQYGMAANGNNPNNGQPYLDTQGTINQTYTLNNQSVEL